MAWLGRKLLSFLWWTYPRGGVEYDVMVGLILAFIFLTPRSFFRDQPRTQPQGSDPFAAIEAPLAVYAAAPAYSLDQVVAALNQSGPQLKSLTADIQNDQFDALSNQTDTKTGAFYLQKTATGAQLAVDFEKPGKEIVVFRNQTLWVVQPTLKTGRQIDVSQRHLPVEEFLALGIGGRGDDLRSNYALRLEGEPAINGSATVQLELIPNDAAVRNYYPRMELWLDPALDWVAVQQKFWLDKSNFSLNHYTHIAPNKPIPAARFDTRFPGIALTRQ